MKTIAFKRAKHPFIHPEYIVEYIDATLLDTLDGWETLLEDKFAIALKNGQKKQEDMVKQLLKEEELIKRAQRDAETAKILKKKEEERDYNRFKAWLKHNPSNIKRY